MLFLKFDKKDKSWIGSLLKLGQTWSGFLKTHLLLTKPCKSGKLATLHLVKVNFLQLIFQTNVCKSKKVDEVVPINFSYEHLQKAVGLKPLPPTATFWTLGPLDPEKERTSFAKLKSYIDKKNCTLRFGNHWPVWHLPKRNSPTSFAKEPIVRWHSFPTHSFSSGGLSASDTYTWRHFVPAFYHPWNIFAPFEGKG